MMSTRARATIGLATAWIAVALLLWVWGALGGPGPVLPVPGETAVLAVDPDHAPEYMLSLWLHWDPADRAPAWAVLEAGARWAPGAELQWRRRIHPGWNQLIWPTLPPIPAGAPLALRVVEGNAASWALGEVRLSDGYRAAHLVPLRGLLVAMGLAAIGGAGAALGACRRRGPLRVDPWLVAVVGIVGIGLGLRMRTLVTHGFWFDEVLTAIGAQSLAWALYAPNVFGHPPVQYLAGWLTGHADGEALRLPFALAGAATIAALAFLGRRLLGAAAGLLAAALLAVSPFHVEISQLARPYAIFVLLSTLALLALVRALESGRAGPWLAWASLATMSCYTHYLGFVTLAVFGLITVMWIAADRGRGWERAGLAFGLWATLLLPWRPLLERQASQHVGTGTVAPGALAELLWGVVAPQLVGPGRMGLAALALAALGLGIALRRRPRAGAVAALWLGAPIVIIWAAQPYHFLAGRHLAFLQPVLLLLVGHGIATLGRLARRAVDQAWTEPRRAWSRLAAGAVAGVVLLVVAGASAGDLAAYYRLRAGPDWRTIAGMLDDLVAPGERVVARLGAAYPLRHYWKGDAVVEMDPTALALPRRRAPRERAWIVTLQQWDDEPALADWLANHATKVAEVGPSWSLPRVFIYEAATAKISP